MYLLIIKVLFRIQINKLVKIMIKAINKDGYKGLEFQIVMKNKKTKKRFFLNLMSFLLDHQIKCKSLNVIKKNQRLGERSAKKKKWKK